ncbi:ABC transporter C family member 3-like [Macadamia integrifolia]|uniref:ABC transporter C family member 3-like n=1 Tax=Macadamia integrifolia TaxID=60698 RepID=UPI001C4FE287|nr:ABC transporter C family member 3-like [Macadamia integrifolia]
MSCSYLVIHIGLYWKHISFPFLLWVSDVVSIIASLLFFYAGLFGNGREDEGFLLLEPLLKTSSSRNNGDDGQGSSVGGESVTPYANADFLSIFTFSWMRPLLKLGYEKALDLEDVPQLANYHSANVVFTRFRNKFESNGNGSGKVSIFKLMKSLILLTWKEILWTALLSIVCTLASYVGPLLIETFVQYLNSPHQEKYKGYTLVFVFFLSKLLRCLLERHLFFQLRNMAIMVRTALFSIIYKKCLTLSSQSKQGHTNGESINLMSVDVERIGVFSWYLHDIWKVPLQLFLALLILYKSLGFASFVAFFATMILMLLNVPLGKLQETFQGKLMDAKDRRMKVTSEALRNMRILKLRGWDMRFLANIIELRNFETRWLKKLLYTTSAINSFVYSSAPLFVSMATFGFCMLMEIPLGSGNILSALATFEILQLPIYCLPTTISMVVQTKVSLDRITSYLCLNDLHPNMIQKLQRDNVEVAVEIVSGNFSWDLSSPNLTLKDLNFRVYHGTRVAVCGSIGSGKSSLLSCLLGELSKVSGIIKLNGTKAYVAQSPWIQSGKIVDNILFGKEMDKERYEMILEACSLNKDLELCPFGDQTIIGERGINLSGGQKQRIQIARALYHDADIYLLDDPFSAVDAHTGTHLFKECLLGILSSKTVIYVTHQIEFLSSADLILVMRDGKISQVGKYKEILSSGTNFIELVGAHKKALADLNCVKRRDSFDNLSNGEEDVSSYWMVLVTPVSKDVRPHERGSTIIFVYIALTLGSSLCVLIRSMLIASLDQSALDTFIPNQIEELIISITGFLGTVAVMSQAAWKMLIIFIPMIVICIWYQMSGESSRALSPIYSRTEPPRPEPPDEADFELNLDAETEDLLDSQANLTLVGKILDGKPFRQQAVNDALVSAWHLLGEVHITPVASHGFIFLFSHPLDIKNVLEGSPWSVSGNLLVFRVVESHRGFDIPIF